jgi:hypothetical protein
VISLTHLWRRIPLTSGDEHDAFTGWRRYLSPRAGQRKRAKRGYWRRFRHKVHLSLRMTDDA